MTCRTGKTPFEKVTDDWRYNMENKEQRKICNCCGKEIHVEPMTDREEYLEVEKEWGYFSRKDGEIHHFILCESCYDRLTEHFCIPVDKKMQTELL